MLRVLELINRQPNDWEKISIEEFHKDIKTLQDFCEYYCKIDTSIELGTDEGSEGFISLLDYEIKINKNVLNYLASESDVKVSERAKEVLKNI